MAIKICVIGAGPGGYVAAIRAAQLGGEVTIIEREKLGGTCLNIGCIPTKSLLHSAEMFDAIGEANDYGLNVDIKGFDWQKVQAKKNTIVNQLVSGVAGLMKINKIKVIKGSAKFETPHSLWVVSQDGKQEKVMFDKVIIATGSESLIPNIPGIKDSFCIDSTGALSLKSVPKSMFVIGGGVIGIELATVYSIFGCKVTLVKRSPTILPMMDQELTHILVEMLKQRGIEIITGVKILSIENVDGQAKINTEVSGIKKTFTAEKVLSAAGRKIDTADLALDKIGVKTDARGGILVNDKMETSVKNIYAIGDCLGKVMLAHTASAQGEVASENALGGALSYDGKTSPLCVYTIPEFAGVGMTEEELKEKKINYAVGKFPLYANGKSLIVNGGDGMVKVLIGKEYDEVLGVHILGPRATDMIAQGALMIGMEAAAEDVCACIHAHPTIAEAIREAFLAAKSRAIHIPNK
jgi:dihydrolipoamide dehydrogenase